MVTGSTAYSSHTWDHPTSGTTPTQVQLLIILHNFTHITAISLAVTWRWSTRRRIKLCSAMILCCWMVNPCTLTSWRKSAKFGLGVQEEDLLHIDAVLLYPEFLKKEGFSRLKFVKIVVCSESDVGLDLVMALSLTLDRKKCYSPVLMIKLKKGRNEYTANQWLEILTD